MSQPDEPSDGAPAPPDRHRAFARHRMPASVKLLATALLVVSVALLPAAAGIWALAAVPLLLVVVVRARVPMRPLLHGILLGEPFVLGAALLLLLRPNGAALFAAVVAKATVCLAALQVLIRSTPLHEIVDVLRRARFPGVLVDTLALLHRYLPVLSDESTRMRRARAARAFGRPEGASWRLLAGLIGILFVRSTLRAERVDAAMRARGWP